MAGDTVAETCGGLPWRPSGTVRPSLCPAAPPGGRPPCPRRLPARSRRLPARRHPRRAAGRRRVVRRVAPGRRRGRSAWCSSSAAVGLRAARLVRPGIDRVDAVRGHDRAAGRRARTGRRRSCSSARTPATGMSDGGLAPAARRQRRDRRRASRRHDAARARLGAAGTVTRREPAARLVRHDPGARRHRRQRRARAAQQAQRGVRRWAARRLTVATVERSTGVRIDHYVEVDFLGFVELVNAVGGVDVCTSGAAARPQGRPAAAGGHDARRRRDRAGVRPRPQPRRARRPGPDRAPAAVPGRHGLAG